MGNSLVEVQMRYFEAGKPMNEGWIDENSLAVLIGEKLDTYPNTNSGDSSSYSIEDVKELGKFQLGAPQMLFGEVDKDGIPEYIFDKPIALFSFRFFGESNDEQYSGGAEWDISEGEGTGAWFSECADDLVEYGLKAIAGEKGESPEGKFARWVVLMSFFGETDYYGEYDCTTEYLGCVDLESIKAVQD